VPRRRSRSGAWRRSRSPSGPHLHLFIATSDIHLKHKLRIDRDEALRPRSSGSATGARSSAGRRDRVQREDALADGPDFLLDVYEAVVDAGATTVNVPDTVGYAIPASSALVGRVVERVGTGATVSVHCHNDLGLATANTLARGPGRRAAGGGDHQRARRACRQRVAGRGRDGAPDAPGEFDDLAPRRRPSRSRPRAGWSATSPASSSSRTRRSSGGNAFAHESGSTRTACSRTR
jgi:isopropylmalate/homocitrate/citramalate synthase